MTAKEYLRQIQLLDQKINQRIEEKESLQAMAECAGIQAADSERVQTSPKQDKISRIIDRYIDMEHEIDSMIDQFVDLRHKIIGQIESMSDERHVVILYKRYVKYEKWEQIAIEMGYTFRYIIMLHGEALNDFQKHFL